MSRENAIRILPHAIQNQDKMMRIFRDVPTWYKERLRKAYRKNTDKILRCPNLMTINHLIQGCELCGSVGRYSSETAVLYNYDRLYVIPNNPYIKFCIRTLVKHGRHVYTSFEFPTPKITSKNLTRIPQFYDPLAGLLYDCFVDEEDLDKNSSAYLINRAHKVCSEYGLLYCQLVVNKKQFMAVHKQSTPELEQKEYNLLLDDDPPF